MPFLPVLVGESPAPAAVRPVFYLGSKSADNLLAKGMPERWITDGQDCNYNVFETLEDKSNQIDLERFRKKAGSAIAAGRLNFILLGAVAIETFNETFADELEQSYVRNAGRAKKSTIKVFHSGKLQINSETVFVWPLLHPSPLNEEDWAGGTIASGWFTKIEKILQPRHVKAG